MAVTAEEPFQNASLDIDDLASHVLKEIAHFFEVYKDLEGKRVQIIRWEPREAANREILESIQRYRERLGAAATT